MIESDKKIVRCPLQYIPLLDSADIKTTYDIIHFIVGRQKRCDSIFVVNSLGEVAIIIMPTSRNS